MDGNPKPRQRRRFALGCLSVIYAFVSDKPFTAHLATEPPASATGFPEYPNRQTGGRYGAEPCSDTLNRMRSSILIAIVAAGISAAAAPNALTKEEKAAGWKLLFDGKSMENWEAGGDSWVIDDGALKSAPKPKIREDLFTKATFGNFELSWEWKIEANGNSGLKYRIQDRFFVDERRIKEYKRFEDLANEAARTRTTKRSEATQEYIVGFEYQMIDNDGHPDARRGPYYQTGAIYSMIPPSQAVAKAAGEYNLSKVVVRGNHVEHWLNGIKVAEGNLDDPKTLEKSAARWTAESPIHNALAKQPKKNCPIALQNHGDAAWFRSIKIRKL